MDHQQQSPQASILSGPTRRESVGYNDQYGSGDESLGGDVNDNGDGPRKAQCRPVRVS